MLSEEEMAINRLECGNTAHSRNADYIQLAIKALKKQVPVKPIMYKFFDDLEDLYKCCPNCKDILTDRIPGNPKDFYFYCMNCGQKLDWGDSN